VEILAASNPMITPVSSFDSESDLIDLDWVSLGTVLNTGSTTLQVPIVGPGTLSTSYMIRTADEKICAVFDFVSGGTGKSIISVCTGFASIFILKRTFCNFIGKTLHFPRVGWARRGLLS
jgi:hypothetical protein